MQVNNLYLGVAHYENTSLQKTSSEVLGMTIVEVVISWERNQGII